MALHGFSPGFRTASACLLSGLAAEGLRQSERDMIDFATARRMMVDGQVRPNDVTDSRILGAMLETPRERFLPPAKASLAYLDYDLPILDGPDGRPRRRMLKPMLFGKMMQAVGLRETDTVLDVGCGTGYSSAIIAQLARVVVALEEEAALALAAKENLYALGITNVSVETGPLAVGYPARAPYDVIFLQGATEVEPQALLAQLRDGGRLVCVRERGALGTVVLYRRAGDDVSGLPSFDATASVLPGFTAAPAFVF
jgi:protein-L-isoaspartate(D-aspartate) O-methyltransferase